MVVAIRCPPSAPATGRWPGPRTASPSAPPAAPSTAPRSASAAGPPPALHAPSTNPLPMARHSANRTAYPVCPTCGSKYPRQSAHSTPPISASRPDVPPRNSVARRPSTHARHPAAPSPSTAFAALPQVRARVVDVQHPDRPRQMNGRLPPDPLRPVRDHTHPARLPHPQPAGHPSPARPQLVARPDARMDHPHVRGRQVPLLPVRPARRRPPPLPPGEDGQPHLPPAGRGVHARPVRLELHVPARRPERRGRLRVVPLPVSHRPAVLVAHRPNRVVAHRQPAELLQVPLARSNDQLAPARQSNRCACGLTNPLTPRLASSGYRPV
jgi:hypothetical protein